MKGKRNFINASFYDEMHRKWENFDTKSEFWSDSISCLSSCVSVIHTCHYRGAKMGKEVNFLFAAPREGSPCLYSAKKGSAESGCSQTPLDCCSSWSIQHRDLALSFLFQARFQQRSSNPEDCRGQCSKIAYSDFKFSLSWVMVSLTILLPS